VAMPQRVNLQTMGVGRELTGIQSAIDDAKTRS
jgi:hypothetical protein